MYPEENACQATSANYPTPLRSTGRSLQDVSRPSELTELKEQVAVNSNRVRMTAQRLRDFLVRVQGNFPMQDGGAVNRPERQGTLGEIYDITRDEADQLGDIEQYLDMIEKIG